MNYTCPVCGFDQLPEPPTDYLICPSCGTEFGYTDFNVTHEELFRRWLANGMKWYSIAFMPPPGWNPVLQIAKREPTAISHAASAASQVTLNGSLVNQDEDRVKGIGLQIFGTVRNLQTAIQPIAV